MLASIRHLGRAHARSLSAAASSTGQGSFFAAGGTTLADALGFDSVKSMKLANNPIVIESVNAMQLANPLGVDSCEICGLDVKHACAICRQGIDVVVECVEPELQFLGFELEPIEADQQRL